MGGLARCCRIPYRVAAYVRNGPVRSGCRRALATLIGALTVTVAWRRSISGRISAAEQRVSRKYLLHLRQF